MGFPKIISAEERARVIADLQQRWEHRCRAWEAHDTLERRLDAVLEENLNATAELTERLENSIYAQAEAHGIDVDREVLTPLRDRWQASR